MELTLRSYTSCFKLIKLIKSTVKLTLPHSDSRKGLNKSERRHCYPRDWNLLLYLGETRKESGTWELFVPDQSSNPL